MSYFVEHRTAAGAWVRIEAWGSCRLAILAARRESRTREVRVVDCDGLVVYRG